MNAGEARAKTSVAIRAQNCTTPEEEIHLCFVTFVTGFRVAFLAVHFLTIIQNVHGNSDYLLVTSCGMSLIGHDNNVIRFCLRCARAADIVRTILKRTNVHLRADQRKSLRIIARKNNGGTPAKEIRAAIDNHIQSSVNAMFVVYAICEPATRLKRYIGCTYFLKSRIYAHTASAKTCRKSDCKLHPWLRKAISEGAKPSVEILFQSDSRMDALEKEREFITKYEADLYNSDFEKKRSVRNSAQKRTARRAVR